MKKHMALAAVGCAAVLTAGGTAAFAAQNRTAATATAGSALRPCGAQQLSAGLHGFQAGVGNRGFILSLTNTGSSSCTLYGYPGLGLENASHQVLPSHTHWGATYFYPDSGRNLIVLSPGETASADVAYHHGFGQSTDSVATYLEVTPPNAYTHLIVRIPGAPMPIVHGQLSVTAMARHTPY
jgi:hypothetical protein